MVFNIQLHIFQFFAIFYSPLTAIQPFPLLTVSHSNMQPSMESSPEVMTLHSKDPHFEIKINLNQAKNSAFNTHATRHSGQLSLKPLLPLHDYSFHTTICNKILGEWLCESGVSIC